MKSFDLVSNRKWLFAFSGVFIVASLVLLAIPPSLRPGIEFTAGTTALYRFEQPVDQAALRDAYAELGHPEARVQATGDGEFLIRTSELNIPEGSFTEVSPEAPVAGGAVGIGTVLLGTDGQEGDVGVYAGVGGSVCEFGAEVASAPAGTEATVLERHNECAESGEGAVLRVLVAGRTGNILEADTHAFAATGEQRPEEGAAPPPESERDTIEAALAARFGQFEVVEFSSVSAVVSSQAVRNATIAIVVAALFIMAYVAFAFRTVPSPGRYAACAVIALVHDVIIVLGAFSLFGKVFDTEINLMFITGLLTVIGFSVHDSIVVFDRIRENVRLYPRAPLHENVNAALAQTLARSFNTTITVLLTVLAMLLLGGVTIQSFLLVLLVGIIAGTYSSVAIAAQLLVSWEEGDFERLFRRRNPDPAPEA